MKVTPREMFDELAKAAQLTDADKLTVARLIADFMSLSARSVAGEPVATDLAMAQKAIQNIQAGVAGAGARVAWQLFMRIAAVAL